MGHYIDKREAIYKYDLYEFFQKKHVSLMR